jgi:RNA polymerase sigma factor (sigma-70 family)
MTLECASDSEKRMHAEQTGHDAACSSNSTAALIRSARLGDHAARHTLLKRFLPLLLRWAHGRLPLAVRDVNDTEDFVQIALIKALKQLASFNSDRPGSFLIYLRRILLNQVRDEVRKRRSRPKAVELDESLPEGEQGEPQLERIIGAEQLSAYQSAVARLSKRQQELVIMRLEFGLS